MDTRPEDAQAKRYGELVFVEWGPIEVVQVRLGRTKYSVWLRTAKPPRHKVYRCHSAAAARRKYRDLKSLKVVNAKDHHGYKALPAGTRIRIRPPRRAAKNGR